MPKPSLAFIAATLIGCTPCSCIAAEELNAITAKSDTPGVITNFTFNGFTQPLNTAAASDAQITASISIDFTPLGPASITSAELDFQDSTHSPRQLADSYAEAKGPAHLIFPMSQLSSIYRFLEANYPSGKAQIQFAYDFSDPNNRTITPGSVQIFTVGTHGQTILIKKHNRKKQSKSKSN